MMTSYKAIQISQLRKAVDALLSGGVGAFAADPYTGRSINGLCHALQVKGFKASYDFMCNFLDGTRSLGKSGQLNGLRQTVLLLLSELDDDTLLAYAEEVYYD